jgi:hypothetical protein
MTVAIAGHGLLFPNYLQIAAPLILALCSTKNTSRPDYETKIAALWGQPFWKIGAPGTIRTCDPLIRSQVLYPAELRVREDGI